MGQCRLRHPSLLRSGGPPPSAALYCLGMNFSYDVACPYVCPLVAENAKGPGTGILINSPKRDRLAGRHQCIQPAPSGAMLDYELESITEVPALAALSLELPSISPDCRVKPCTSYFPSKLAGLPVRRLLDSRLRGDDSICSNISNAIREIDLVVSRRSLSV